MKELELGAGSFKGYYKRDRTITFKTRPKGEWEYMATGTGTTGVAVLAHDQLILQINHEGSFDENGSIQPICRLHLDFEGDPISSSDYLGKFKMVHDLQHSVITITAGTEDGELKIDIRAGIEQELICIDVTDRRKLSRRLILWYETPWPAFADSLEGGELCLWHDNGSNTEWHDINIASGFKDDSDFTDILKNRCFGFSIKIDDNSKLKENRPVWTNNHIIVKDKENIRVYIAAAAKIGFQALKNELEKRMSISQDVFIYNHEVYWNNFWNKVWFETDEETMLCHMAAYDLYRYFCAIAAGKEREFPMRFQIELLRSNFTYHNWMTMQIHSIQTIQAYYGCMKNGDWDCLEAFLKDYHLKLPFYRKFCKDYFGHEGSLIAYETNPWGSIHFDKAYGTYDKGTRRLKNKVLYHLDVHVWSMYSFEHGMAIMQFILNVANSKRDEALINDIVLPYAHEMCKFFLTHFSKENGKLVFDPATSGETWFNVKNPTSWIFLFRAFLPDVITLAEQKNLKKLASLAKELLECLPEITKGCRSYTKEEGVKVWNDPENEIFLPAEVFDRHPPINRENPEMYGLWPYGYLGIGKPEFEITTRTFESRIWKNINTGWALDIIWEAGLGMTDRLLHDYENYHFQATVRCPGGFSYEEAPTMPSEPRLPLVPSMQGMGTSVCHIYEMICQDRSDHILLLPAWPMDRPLRIALYSKVAGRLELEYIPGGSLYVSMERNVDIKSTQKINIMIVSRKVIK